MIANANGVNLYYQKTGEGPPMILLHGNGEDHTIFDKLAEKLKDHFTLYAVDSRNHGQSDKTGVYDYRMMAADIHAFLLELQISQADFIGFSDGAIITLLLAMAHPEQIRRMALLGINLKPSDLTDRCTEYVRDMLDETGDPLFRLMLEQPDIELDELKSVSISTLLVAAEREICKPELYPTIRDTMPDAELLIVPGHKHETYIVGNDLLYADFCRFFGIA